MKITICGSIAFFPEMLEAKAKLESLGHEVKMPPTEVPDESGKMIPVEEFYKLRKTVSDEKSWIWTRKEEAMRVHFDKVAWSDAILVLNLDKNGMAGYVGPNTFLEMGLAFHLKKKIFMLNSIPEISYKEEIVGLKPIVIGQDFEVAEEKAKEEFVI